jgi:hypothetical protein
MATVRWGVVWAAIGLGLSTLAQAGPAIFVEPSPVIVSPGESVQVRATVQGPSEYRVRWILQGPLRETSDIGTLSEDGLYTAPKELPRGPIRIVVQVSLGKYNLPVAAASVPVDVVPPGFKPPEMPVPGALAPPPPPPPPEPSRPGPPTR